MRNRVELEVGCFMENLLKESLIIVLMVSGIPMLIATSCGLVVAVFQAATQISEQSISYLVRFVATSVVLALGFGWFASQILEFMEKVLSSLQYFGRMP